MGGIEEAPGARIPHVLERSTPRSPDTAGATFLPCCPRSPGVRAHPRGQGAHSLLPRSQPASGPKGLPSTELEAASLSLPRGGRSRSRGAALGAGLQGLPPPSRALLLANPGRHPTLPPPLTEVTHTVEKFKVTEITNTPTPPQTAVRS